MQGITLIENLSKHYGHFFRGDVLYSHKGDQDVLVLETKQFGRILAIDGVPQLSEADEFMYHEPLVHPVMLAHPNPEQVLIIGGGDGGALEEVLKHGCVRKAVMVDIDRTIIELAKQFFRSVCGNAFVDPRTELVIGDGRKYVEEAMKKSERFDIVIIDLTDPGGPSKYLWTREFYAMVKEILKPNGLMATHSESPFFEREEFSIINKTIADVFPIVRRHYTFVPSFGLPFGYTYASNDLDPCAVSKEEIERRAKERGIGGLRYYSAAMHPSFFSLPRYAEELIERCTTIATDAQPIEMEQIVEYRKGRE